VYLYCTPYLARARATLRPNDTSAKNIRARVVPPSEEGALRGGEGGRGRGEETQLLRIIFIRPLIVNHGIMSARSRPFITAALAAPRRSGIKGRLRVVRLSRSREINLEPRSALTSRSIVAIRFEGSSCALANTVAGD